MPLPDRNNVTWPPPATRDADDLYTRWGAWYSGDPDQLTAAYAALPSTLGGGGDDDGTGGKRGMPGGARFAGGTGRGVQRMFWGAALSAGQQRAHKLHVPLAGDIAATSADLLFGESPEFEFADEPKDGPTRTRLDEILDEANAAAVWLEAAETAAAYGGAYVRIRIDPAVADCPLLDVIPPDTAVPEFRGGRLVAVTFWRNLARTDGKWWRHLERHEPGKILHGLYVSGDEAKLGAKQPLTAHEETAPLAAVVDAGDAIATGADKNLTAEYLPNMRPNRVMRGSALGRSDYSGVEPFLDSLDESWTSWMRDIRLGKGRLVVPRSYIRSRGRGNGGQFDPEQEVYEAVDALETPGGTGSGLSMTVVQFAIRVEEHSRTCHELTEVIVRSAGYSAGTFGAEDGSAATATEVVSRDTRSMRTRGKKILYARGPVRRLAHALLQVDAAKFGRKTGVKLDVPPTVKWPDGVATDPEAIARTLQMLKAAEAASLYTRVKMLNPDWEESEILEEVDRLKEEAGAGMPVPEPGAPGAALDVGGQGDELAGPPAAAGGKPPVAGKPPAGGKPPVKAAAKAVAPRKRGAGPPTGKPAPAGPAGPGQTAKKSGPPRKG